MLLSLASVSLALVSCFLTSTLGATTLSGAPVPTSRPSLSKRQCSLGSGPCKDKCGPADQAAIESLIPCAQTLSTGDAKGAYGCLCATWLQVYQDETCFDCVTQTSCAIQGDMRQFLYTYCGLASGAPPVATPSTMDATSTPAATDVFSTPDPTGGPTGDAPVPISTTGAEFSNALISKTGDSKSDTLSGPAPTSTTGDVGPVQTGSPSSSLGGSTPVISSLTPVNASSPISGTATRSSSSAVLSATNNASASGPAASVRGIAFGLPVLAVVAAAATFII